MTEEKCNLHNVTLDSVTYSNSFISLSRKGVCHSQVEVSVRTVYSAAKLARTRPLTLQLSCDQ